MEAELFPLFGGYHAYMASPMVKIQKHTLRIQAKWMAEREVNEDADRSQRRKRLIDGNTE